MEKPWNNGRKSMNKHAASPALEGTSGAAHLVVMVHGIGGSAANWSYAKKKFEEAMGEAILIFCSSCIRVPSLGIDVLGQKLAEEVRAVVKQNPQLQKISFVAHSLGGVVSRYAIALLLDQRQLSSRKDSIIRELQCTYSVHSTDGANGTDRANDANVLEEDDAASKKGENEVPRGVLTMAGLHPVNFVTMASPHLGSQGKASFPLLSMVGGLDKLSPTLGPWLLGTTAKHLFLTDAPDPLLLQMTKDCPDLPFLTALKAFQHRTVYANVMGDQLVGWQTSCIRQSRDVPKPGDLKEDPEYKYIQMPCTDLDTTAVAESSVNMKGMSHKCRSLFTLATPAGSDAVRDCQSVSSKPAVITQESSPSYMADIMAINLSRVLWTRVDVNFQKCPLSFSAHNLIQVKDYMWHKAGAAVIQHIIDHFEQ